MSLELPIADEEMVQHCLAEYAAAFHSAGNDANSAKAIEGAKARAVWALVHSRSAAQQQRGLDMAEDALKAGECSNSDDLRYLAAVAQYQLGHLLDARRRLAELLKVRQACSDTCLCGVACDT